MLGVPAGQTNYLLIGMLLGLLAGFLVGSVLMLQIGNQTAAAVRSIIYRRRGGSRVRFELLSQ